MNIIKLEYYRYYKKGYIAKYKAGYLRVELAPLSGDANKPGEASPHLPRTITTMVSPNSQNISGNGLQREADSRSFRPLWHPLVDRIRCEGACYTLRQREGPWARCFLAPISVGIHLAPE